MGKTLPADAPHSIRCLKAIEGFNGGRLRLASKIGVAPQTIAQWVHYRRIPSAHVLALVHAGQNKFSAEELLGGLNL